MRPSNCLIIHCKVIRGAVEMQTVKISADFVISAVLSLSHLLLNICELRVVLRRLHLLLFKLIIKIFYSSSTYK
jgi:hypothetical protein